MKIPGFLRRATPSVLVICTLGLMVAVLSCFKDRGTTQAAKTGKDTLKTMPCGFLDLKVEALPPNLGLKPADSATIKTVAEILDVTGMHLNEQNKNFYLNTSSAFRNVLAISEPVVDPNFNLYIYRFIVYNPALVDSLQQFCSPAAKYVIFAHEISHHLNGDNFMSDEVLQDRRQRELNADSFAGYLCFQLSLTRHFSVDDCLKVYATIADTVDKDVHPKRALRQQNFSNGWNTAKAFQAMSCSAMNQIVQNPIAAINELSSRNPALIRTLKQQSEQSLAGVPEKLTQLAVATQAKAVINLRGDSSVMVADKKILRNANRVAMKSVTGLAANRRALESSPTENTDYIIDTKNIIWARYPNGVPYVAGIVQAIK